MTVAHKNLTGTDLHVIKGADSATTGQVPIANGSGDAPFGKLTHTSLQTTGNPFGAQLFHTREEQSAGVSPNSIGSLNTWSTVTLNTSVTNEITSASLSSNGIILPAGTYFIDAVVPSYYAAGSTSQVKIRLYNNTTSASIIEGRSIIIFNSIGMVSTLSLRGRFTLSGTSTLYLQRYATGNVSGGQSFNHGTEVYSEALVWKVA